MRYVSQFLIILLATFLGEILHFFLPLPVPASIYGLVLLLAALQWKLVRLDQVKAASGLLIELMPLMFIPAAVGLLDSWEQLNGIVVPVLVSTILSTVLVMAVTGRAAQWLVRRERGSKDEKLSV